MNNAATKLKVINENRTLIDVYSNLKDLYILTNDIKLKEAIDLIDKATEILSEV